MKNSGFRNNALIKTLVRVKLICWYGFRNEIVEFGLNTLINGQNMSGKTTLLDAVKYALFGDYEFNISASSAGGSEGRTIASYTECLLSRGGGGKRARSGMIYTHIAAEFHDSETGEYFVCDTMIVTDGSTHRTKTYRFLFENTRIEDIAFYDEGGDGGKVSFDEKEFSSKNGQARAMKSDEGLEKFSDKMGLKLDKHGLTAYRGRMRGLIDYDPDDNIPTLIKKGVLEERPADISKLIAAKKSYEETGKMLKRVEEENDLLDEILRAAGKYEAATERVIKEEIKYDYKEYRSAADDLESAARSIDLDIRKREDLEASRRNAEKRSREANNRLSDAKAKRGSVLAAYKVDEQARKVERLGEDVAAAQAGLKKLEEFVGALDEGKAFVRGITPEEDALAKDVSTGDIPKGRKEQLLLSLRTKAVESEAELDAEKFRAKENLDKLKAEETALKEELKQLKNRSHVPNVGQAGKALRDEINSVLIEKGLAPEAKMAYELVDSLKDEEWRFAVEARLGRRRFGVIVPLELYDIAYDIQLKSGNKDAILVRTKALLDKEIRVNEDDLATILEVSNPIARSYFDYYLRFKMTEPEDVRDYDHAIAKNGFYSDVTYTGYLHMSVSDRFCLGYDAAASSAELINSRLSELSDLKAFARDAYDDSLKTYVKCRNFSGAVATLLDGDIDLAARETLAEAEDALAKEEQRLEEMREEMSRDPKVEELQAKVDAAEKEVADALEEVKRISGDIGKINELIEKHREKRDAAELKLEGDETAEDEEARIGLRQIMEDHKALHEKETRSAVQEYDAFLASGKDGSGVLSARSMREHRANQKQAAEELARGQAVYGDRYYSLGRGTDVIEPYRARKAKVEVTELEKAKAAYNLRKRNCFRLFNTEFLLFIRGCVDDAMKEMRALNDALANVGFKTRYKLEFREKRDGSKFETILRQSKHRAVYGDRMAGAAQMSLADVSSADEAGEQGVTEAEMESLMDDIIQCEDFSKFEDYRNYLDYDVILEGDDYPEGGARLTEEHGGNSGAGRQIPYTIILTCGLLNLYNRRKSCTRLLFMDEPFKTLDAANVDVMLEFFKAQNLQAIFVAGNKDDEIGPHCDMITPVVTNDGDKSDMRIGRIKRKNV